MKLVTKEQMQAIDQKAINDYAVPSLLLMEHAAYSLFKIIEELPPSKIVIVCGSGNNGGDGFALARQLAIWSLHQVTIIMMSDSGKISSDAKIYYSICKSMDIAIVEYNSKEYRHQLLEEADYLVDALLGTGLSKAVRGDLYHMIEAMNASKKPIISIDIPSGICANTGKILGVAIRAWKTITFALPKIGLYIYPGILYANEIICTDIGIPAEILRQTESHIEAITKDDLRKWMPERLMRSNKGTYGKVLVIGGQRGMSGAVTLAAQSALKVGAGIVTAAVPRAIHDILEQKLTEVMTIPLSDVGGHLGVDAIEEIEKLIDQYSLVILGPGIGRSNEIQKIVEIVLKSNKPCVIDADGLYGLKPLLDQVKERTAPLIMTPHPGELSHLMEVPISVLLEEPLLYTQKFARDYNAIVVFKIERTLISNGVKTWVNTTGNTGLAKGGSGDVLAGMIGGMMAQGLEALEAAAFAVYCHGQAADTLCQKTSAYTLMPSGLIDELDQVFHNL